MNNESILRQMIESFFRGRDVFETNIGHVWIAKHGYKRVDRRILKQILHDEIDIYGDFDVPHISKIDKADENFGYIPEFETLTIEPKNGGQYEIAVRIWSTEDNQWKGYFLSNLDLYTLPICDLVGVNTRGH